MTRTTTALVLAAFAAAAGVTVLGFSSAPAAAQSADAQPSKPLRGKVYYGRRKGGYSYKPNQTMSTAEARRFWDPGSTLQSPSGPFDSGFFFDSATGPHGGNAPYQQ